MSLSIYSLPVIFCMSLVMNWALLLTKNWHGIFSFDHTEGVQKTHVTPTPRIGGLVIYLSLILGLEIEDQSSLLANLLLAAIPAFLFGLIEDLTKRVSVRTRLLATLVSGLLGWWLTGYSLTRVNIVGVDALLYALPLVSVLFTCFAVSGFANAINIIDGLHGLASGVVLICLLALGAIAYQIQDWLLLNLIGVVILATLGFFVVNFPFGKIFLGDGGAYLLGFLVAWFAILLPMRNDSVSVWATLLIGIYPVTEVLFSMLRRYCRKHHPGHPDRLHLHSLIHARITKKKFRHLPPHWRNAAASLPLWGLTMLSGLVATLCFQNSLLLCLATVGFMLGYRVLYRRLLHFKT